MYAPHPPTTPSFPNTLCLNSGIIGIYNEDGIAVGGYKYNAWGQLCKTWNEAGYEDIVNLNPFRYRGYYFDQETGYYYLNSRYYDCETRRFISSDDVSYLGADGGLNSFNLYAYCGNNPVMYVDPTGEFFISTTTRIGAVIGAIAGAIVGGVVAYNVAKDNDEGGWELVGWTIFGVVSGAAIGAAVGAGIGYGIGYVAGGTYSNGLVAKSVGKGVKTFMSQTNKVHHVLKKARHNLTGYTARSVGILMKKTLAKGVVGVYKGVKSAYWAVMGSEVTFVVVNGIIKISDMWIK